MPKVTICVPVFNGESFVEQTLESISRQTYIDIEVLISVDASTDNSLEICRRHNASYQVFEQATNLGWVKNCNFLLKKVGTQFFCIIPHDDIISETYVEELMGAAQENPQASVVYSDIKCIGLNEGVIIQEAVTRDRLERMLSLMRGHFAAVAFRGLVNTCGMGEIPLLREDVSEGFACDTLWMFELAYYGELLRLPRELYIKKMYEGSAHSKWNRWSLEKTSEVWLEHCLRCFEVCSETHECDEEEIHELALSTVERFWKPEIFWGKCDLTQLSPRGIKAYSMQFKDALKRLNPAICTNSGQWAVANDRFMKTHIFQNRKVRLKRLLFKGASY